MLRPLSLSFIRRVPRLFILASLVLVGSVSATSCLTPDATFSSGDGDQNLGGQNGDGDSTASHCSNRRVDADETDIDCGGRDCDPCALGRMCEAGSDCVNGTCTASRCQMPSCTDGVKNSSETDEDCGGTGCPPCADGKRCETNTDCESASCKGGFCAEPTCTDRIKNGNESDVDCGGSCDPCESGSDCVVTADCMQPPEDDPAISSCSDGVCTLVCDTRSADCNFRVADGCEVDIFSDLFNCGACGEMCDPPHAVGGICNDGQCEIDFEGGGCVAPWSDCNGEHDDGCEINTNNNPAHCSDCNAACSDQNGTPSCSAGNCAIACDNGYTNCDGDTRETGCEIRTETNAAMCGDCDTNCHDEASQTQSAYCVDGACGFTTCDAGKGDCSGSGTCSHDLNTIQNCGGCGQACSVSNATTSCVSQGGGNFACAIATCSSGGGATWQDCDSSYANGCETNVNSSLLHCGGCVGSGGQSCAALMNNVSNNIASIICDAGACRITGCNAGYADCDNNPNNGCEVNTNTNTNRCGGCLTSDPRPGSGETCSTKWAHANGSCSGGSCNFTGCHANWGNCLNGLTDGCETDLRVTTAHCGMCGAACQNNTYTSTNSCSNSQCSATCNINGAKCDANEWNGCENIATDVNNCGACGNRCGGANQTGVATASCSSRSCNVTCNNGMCPSATASATCTIPLGTTSNCSFCGEVCSGSTNICTATGCKDHLPITVAGSKNFTSGTPNGSTTYTLTSTNPNRGLILALASFRGPTGPSTAGVSWTTGSSAMTVAHRQLVDHAEATIYYLNQAALPAAGTTLTITVSNPENWGGLVASVIEVADMYQAGNPVHNAGGNTVGTGCPHLNTRSALVGHENSMVVAVAVARENSAGTASPMGVNEIHDTGAGNQTHGAIGYATGVNSNRTAGFNMSLCWHSAVTTATFRPWRP